jgi:hypothetical protein
MMVKLMPSHHPAKNTKPNKNKSVPSHAAMENCLKIELPS